VKEFRGSDSVVGEVSKTDHGARTRRYFPRLPSRRFVAAVIAIGGIELMATMDGPIAVFALPKIQNELGLSDAGRSWVITAYLLTFGGLMLLGGRLGDTIGRKRAFIVGVAVFTIASTMCGIAWDEGTLGRALSSRATAPRTSCCRERQPSWKRCWPRGRLLAM
jgi:MFS family permease